MKVNWEGFFGDGRFSEYVVENVIRNFSEPEDVLLDGGANEGRHTLVGLAAGATVIAVEPIPELAERIRDRAAEEVPNNSRLMVVSAALSSAAGTASFSYCPGRSTLSGLHARARLTALEVRQLVVEKVTIDQLVGRLGVRAPSIIKLDLEGGEFDAIRGAGSVLDHHPVLLFEHGGEEGAKLYGYTNEQYYELVRNLGYKLLQINGRECSKDDFLRPRHWNYCALHLDMPRHRQLLETFDYLTADAAQKMCLLHGVRTSF